MYYYYINKKVFFLYYISFYYFSSHKFIFCTINLKYNFYFSYLTLLYFLILKINN